MMLTLRCARASPASLMTTCCRRLSVGRTATTLLRSSFGPALLGAQQHQYQHQQLRYLNVHEHISTNLMQQDPYNIRVPEFHVANTSDEAVHIFEHVLNKPWTSPPRQVVMKAQVLSGGRGLGTFSNGFPGGVHVVNSADEVQDYASHMLGQKLITKQNQKGLVCNKVLLVEKIDAAREMYLSLFYDRASAGFLMVGSPSGGTSIEDVAKSNPELIFQVSIIIMTGLTDQQCDTMATNLGFSKTESGHAQACELMKKMYNMFIERDCKQIEINPLAETTSGDVYCLDAKCSFDDNAQYRQQDIFALRDFTQEDPCETDAEKYDLNYVHLEGGTIGCMVNGAGLAMATMDLIHEKGGEPAVFLDCGGGASEAQVQKAFEIMNSDPYVQAIFVNIFGGIMRCDVIASGIIKAHKHIGVQKPVIIRLRGNRVQEALHLLENSDVPLILVDDYEEAAEMAIEMAVKFRDLHEEIFAEMEHRDNVRDNDKQSMSKLSPMIPKKMPLMLQKKWETSAIPGKKPAPKGTAVPQ